MILWKDSDVFFMHFKGCWLYNENGKQLWQAQGSNIDWHLEKKKKILALFAARVKQLAQKASMEC